jgi:hypothetical protein
MVNKTCHRVLNGLLLSPGAGAKHGAESGMLLKTCADEAAVVAAQSREEPHNGALAAMFEQLYKESMKPIIQFGRFTLYARHHQHTDGGGSSVVSVGGVSDGSGVGDARARPDGSYQGVAAVFPLHNTAGSFIGVLRLIWSSEVYDSTFHDLAAAFASTIGSAVWEHRQAAAHRAVAARQEVCLRAVSSLDATTTRDWCEQVQAMSQKVCFMC